MSGQGCLPPLDSITAYGTVRTWYTAMQPPRSAFTERPVNVLEQLQTTLLCCNCVLKERGFSRLIAGFHKDLLQEDVIERLTLLNKSKNKLRVDDETRIPLVREIYYYMTLFAKYEKVYCMGLRYCRHCQHITRESLSVVALAAMLKGPTYHQTYHAHTRLLLSLSDLLLKFHAIPWSLGLIDRFLNLGGEEIVLRDLTSLTSWTNGHLNVHRLGRRRDLLKALRDSIVDRWTS
jgi:hypothetical protein